MSITLLRGDALDQMKQLPVNSVDLIATDPPYFKVKNEPWDRQWDKPDKFIEWIGQLCEEWERILKPNGSLYVFASPRMATSVESEMSSRFSILNRIRWRKLEGRHKASHKEGLRCYFPASEEIIFAEHYNSESYAKGEAGYAAKCDELRGFVFEPLRAYLATEWERAGLTAHDANMATGTQMAGHYLTRSQWALPTKENYEKLRAYANRAGGEELRREYEELRREYEELRREYEELRRPFSVTANVPYTDVWDFKTVQSYPGKHPCEKPLAMMEHIIRASSRPNAVVLDCFMGSGTTGVAALNLGRSFIGIEMNEDYFAKAKSRIDHNQTSLFAVAAE